MHRYLGADTVSQAKVQRPWGRGGPAVFQAQKQVHGTTGGLRKQERDQEALEVGQHRVLQAYTGMKSAAFSRC